MGPSSRLRGFAAQSMGGPKEKRVGTLQIANTVTTTTTTITLPAVTFNCIVECYLVAGGGGVLGVGSGGGGGGEAAFVRFGYGPGMTAVVVAGAGGDGTTPSDGADSTLTLNGSVIARAKGGKAVNNSATGGLGGTGGFPTTRRGGRGADAVSAASTGETGEFGNPGDAGAGTAAFGGGGGGGAGGFTDALEAFLHGLLNPANLSVHRGAGGSAIGASLANAQNGSATLIFREI